jgi:hypothetical protein
MLRKHQVCVAAIALALLSGCATITKGSSQPVTLHTDPDGAVCDIVREEKTVASVGATPGQVTVDRGWGSLEVRCRKTGYQSIDAKVDSEVQGWTFGNILIGGIIGFAVDAASGAMRQYPQFVTLTLVPEEFASTEAREEYFARTKERFDREGAEALALLQKKCTSEEACAQDAKALQAAKDKRLAVLRAKVDAARIKPPSQSSGQAHPGRQGPLAARIGRPMLAGLL